MFHPALASIPQQTAQYIDDNGAQSVSPSSHFAGLFIYFELSHFKFSHPSSMLAAQAPACHSEFQISPIFPLMARRSGRQHIGEGGPRHAACSRGSIREEGEERSGVSLQ